MKPYVDNIEKDTLSNDYYRRVIYTGDDLQLVLMNLSRDEDIPEETHPDIEQFIRIESGKALIRIGKKEYILEDGDAVIIPKNTPHYVSNMGNKDLKLYTIYSRQEHPKGRRQIYQS